MHQISPQDFHCLVCGPLKQAVVNYIRNFSPQNITSYTQEHKLSAIRVPPVYFKLAKMEYGLNESNFREDSLFHIPHPLPVTVRYQDPEVMKALLKARSELQESIENKESLPSLEVSIHPQEWEISLQAGGSDLPSSELSPSEKEFLLTFFQTILSYSDELLHAYGLDTLTFSLDKDKMHIILQDLNWPKLDCRSRVRIRILKR